MATMIARPEPRSDRNEQLDLVSVAHGRIMLVLLIFAAITLVMAAKMIWMGVDAGTQAERLASPIPVPRRADIVDRNGIPLARDIDGYAIAVRRDKVLGNKRDLARKLHEIFPDEAEELFYAKLTSGAKWAYLRKSAVPREVSAVNALGEIGIEFPREPERLYPQRSLAAHLIGFVDRDGFGSMGVERAFDDRLKDRQLRGQPLQLSIDSRVQAALEEELMLGVADQKAKGAVGLVLDSRNGEVVAMASLPTFNPNRIDPVPAAPPVMGRDGKMYPGKVTCDMSPRCNRAVQALYELGSTFKPLSFAIAMDAGVIVSMTKRYDATAPLQVGRYSIKDDHPMGRWLTVPEALVHSSNIVTARIADEMGQKPLETTYRALEFDRPATIDLREQANTLFPTKWYRTTIMTTAYGHGIAVTPMHLASAYAALVNGGVWHPTTVIKRKPSDPVVARRIFSEQTSAKMRQLLRMIVQTGTGRNADAEGYRVGGKTGTAEKPKDGGYAKRSLVSTFAAAFPMESPRYVVLVMMDEPQGSARFPGIRTAAYTAAPVVKAFVSRAGPLLGIFPEASRDVDISELKPLVEGDMESE